MSFSSNLLTLHVYYGFVTFGTCTWQSDRHKEILHDWSKTTDGSKNTIIVSNVCWYMPHFKDFFLYACYCIYFCEFKTNHCNTICCIIHTYFHRHPHQLLMSTSISSISTSLPSTILNIQPISINIHSLVIHTQSLGIHIHY